MAGGAVTHTLMGYNLHSSQLVCILGTGGGERCLLPEALSALPTEFLIVVEAVERYQIQEEIAVTNHLYHLETTTDLPGGGSKVSRCLQRVLSWCFLSGFDH